MDVTEVTRIIFYFKYQLQLKKNIDFYKRNVNLAMVWKTARFFQPLLERMRKFAKIYRKVPKEELTRELEMVKKLQQKKENPNVVESKLNLMIIKGTVADNYKQITFQIFDFQIVGVIVLDKDLIMKDEIGPLRAYGPGGINQIVKEKEEELEKEMRMKKTNDKKEFMRQKTIENDFKKLMTLKKKQREKEKKLSEQKESEKEESYNSENELYNDDSPHSTQPNFLENIPSFKQNKTIKNNIFDSGPKDNGIFGIFERKPEELELKSDSKNPSILKPFNFTPKSSGTFRNIRDRRRKKKLEFTTATGGQIDIQEDKKEDRMNPVSIGILE
jgi:hypothetical protein